MSCRKKQDNTSSEAEMTTPINISDLETTYGKLSSFVKEIEMISLEFTDESILSEIKKIVISDDYVFVMEKSNQKGIYVFNRKGNFLYRIGTRGQGPKEFIDLSDFSLNEEEKLVYLYDLQRKKILTFSFQNQFVGEVQMNYFADKFEYQNGLFYLYRENPSFGDPLYSLVVKDKNGKTVGKYYPSLNDSPLIHKCIFRKTEKNILFAQHMNDSIFSLTNERMNPIYYIDYGAKKMSLEDREDIRKDIRPAINVLLEKKTIAGITDVFEINDKVFIKFVNVIIPMFCVYDKTTKETNVFQYFLDDLLFIATNHPIGQYKDCLISILDQDDLQSAIDVGFNSWIDEGVLNMEKADRLRMMIEEKFPNRNTGENNPVVFLLKVS